MRKLFTGLFLILYSAAWCQMPAGYYDDAQGKTGEELKAALHDIIKGHDKLSYDDVWDALQDTDEDPNNSSNVLLLYTGWSYAKGNHGGGISQWNREHTWAKSHGGFGTSQGAGTDIHHLRPTDVTVNSKRGSLDFDEGGTPYIDPDGATGCNVDGDSWEPRDEVKGDVARMLFYMATRYEGGSGEPDLELTDYIPSSGSHLGKMSILVEWHKADPVSDWERHRNNVIYNDYQHNRNPYIDHPEYANYIWGGETPGEVQFSNIQHTPENPKDNEPVEISATVSSGTVAINSVILKWGNSALNLDHTLDMTGNGNSYITTESIPAQAGGVLVCYKIEAVYDGGVATSNPGQYVVSNGNPSTQSIPFTENFQEGSLGLFSSNSVEGDEQWHYSTFSGDASKFAKMSGYDGSQVNTNDDWLISPAMNLNLYANEKISFRSSKKIFDNDENTEMSLLYSVDYDGEGNPTLAQWYDLTDQAEWSVGDYTWVESGEIDLANVSGESVYVAFRYQNEASTSTTWQIDDIKVDGSVGSNVPPVITSVVINPDSPVVNQEIEVSALITDEGTVIEARLLWGETAGNLNNEVNMQLINGKYIGIIPSINQSKTIYYQIKATDDGGLSSATSEYSVLIKPTNGGVETELNFSVSPNPSNGNIIITNATGDKLWCEVFSLSGERVYCEYIYNAKCAIALPYECNGMYIVVMRNDEIVSHKKILINK